MKNSFYKILKFEVKLNFKVWMLLLASSLGILMFIFFRFHSQNNSYIIGGTFIPIFILIASVFTLHSYSESTTKQTMSMYHLLPVSGSTKFFSKQLITFILFPIILLSLYLIFITFGDPLLFNRFNRSLISPNFEPLRTFNFYLWAHSFATFFAVIFRKHKLLYAILFGFIFLFVVPLIYGWVSKSLVDPQPYIKNGLNLIAGYLKIIFEVTYYLVPLIIYIISYRLFIKRQL